MVGLGRVLRLVVGAGSDPSRNGITGGAFAVGAASAVSAEGVGVMERGELGGLSAACNGVSNTGEAADSAGVRTEWGLEAADWTSDEKPGRAVDGEETGTAAWMGCGDGWGRVLVS